MAGWIKLWRALLENGHLKMPGNAFKLWIYCLLEAAPYPDPKRDLSMGELWLSYRGIQENLGEGNHKVSMSTVSAALKYLEQNGYILLQSERFKGIKATVVNWGEYQALPLNSTTTRSPTPQLISSPHALTSGSFSESKNLASQTLKEPSFPTPYKLPQPDSPTIPTVTETNSPTLDKMAAPHSPTPSTVAETDLPTTPRVAEADSPTTPRVANDYSHSSRPTTPSVAVRAPQTYGGKASNPDKNYIKNGIKTINPVVVVDIANDFTQEFGRPLSPIERKQLVKWQETFPEDLIKEALTRASLLDKRSIAYVGGILKNWSRNGLMTVAETRKEPTKPIPRGGKRSARSIPGYHPHEVDWANEPDTL